MKGPDHLLPPHMIDKVREAIARCARCGKCRSVCPIFAQMGDETMVARGRIALMQAVLDGDIETTKRFETYIQYCLKCLRCASTCPSGVDYEVVIQAARQLIARERGVPLHFLLPFRFVIPYRFVYDTALRIAAFTQPLWPFPKKGTLRHLPLFMFGSRWLPSIQSETTLKHYDEPQPARGQEKMRVGFFTGCLLNYAYTNAANALIKLLQHVGATVVVPKKQMCCGTPTMSFGDVSTAEKLARKNLEVFHEADVDAIVVGCPTCGTTLKNEYPMILNDSNPWRIPIYDISQFLWMHNFQPTRRLPYRITYHDPCHLRFVQGIADEPRELLRRAGTLVEMNGADACCGGAGTFGFLHYEESVAIGDAKAESIESTGAQVMATGCPGCLLQVADRLAAHDSAVQAKHTVEVLAEAIE